MSESMLPLLTTTIGCIITALTTYFFTHKDAKERDRREILSLQNHLTNANSELNTAKETVKKQASTIPVLESKITNLEKISAKYNEVRKKLSDSYVVRTYELPVILLGPREVGKTSLMYQLHTPWTEEIPEPSVKHKYCVIPIYDHTLDYTEPHFADTSINAKVKAHLNLKIHDFPGENENQEYIKRLVIEETQNLRAAANRNIGVVLVLMFDAQEVLTDIKVTTNKYYNGELFKSLRGLVQQGQIDIDRIIIVFNKYDKLKAAMPHISDNELLQQCVRKYSFVFSGLTNVCNPEKVCEIATIFDMENIHINNKGASVVKGEMARAFVAAFIGRAKAQEHFSDNHVTNYSAQHM